jgi:peptide/nickel transport system substrate-binding protein
MKIGDMSVTFKLRKDATFHDGTPVTAKDVKWSLDRAVTVGGFPTFQMSAGSLDQARAVRRRRRSHLPRRFPAQGPADDSRSRGHRPCVINSELVKKNATDRIPGASNTPSSIPPAAAPTR